MSRRLAICPGTADYECLQMFSQLKQMERLQQKTETESVLWQTRHNTLLNRLPVEENLFAGKTPPNRKRSRKDKK